MDESANGHTDEDKGKDLLECLRRLPDRIGHALPLRHRLGLLSIDSFSAHEVSHLVVHPQMLDDGAARNGDDEAHHRVDERHVRAEDTHDEDDGGNVYHGR